jgi:hypothetical protein
VTTKEARQRLQGLVSRFAHIDLREVHRCAFHKIDMETVRLIAKENAKKADAFIFLTGELVTHRDAARTLFATTDPAILLTFTYRYLLVLRYLASAPADQCLYFSSESKRFLEQILIELYNKVEDSVYEEVMKLHAADQMKKCAIFSQE